MDNNNVGGGGGEGEGREEEEGGGDNDDDGGGDGIYWIISISRWLFKYNFSFLSSWQPYLVNILYSTADE